MPDGKKWRAYSPLARRRFLCGNAGLHAIVLHCQRSIAGQRPVGGQSSRSGHRIAGMAWRASSSKTQRRTRRAGWHRAAEGFIEQQRSGAPAGRAAGSPAPAARRKRGRSRGGEACQPGAAKRFLHRGFARLATFSGSASCKFCPTLKWSNSNGS